MRLSDIFERLVDRDVPVGFRAYDGSSAGPADAETVVEVRSPRALRYIATAPGELGLARAYVMGAAEVHGDLYTAITGLLAHRSDTPRPTEWLPWLRELGPSALRRPPVPPEELPAAWRRRLRRH
jgi:cyclopropane-fatty-acyl-phospholipid synthase